MRLFGTFKSIEVYLILTAIFLLFTFDHVCFKKEADMMTYWYPEPDQLGHDIVESSEVNNMIKHGNRRPVPHPPLANSTQATLVPVAEMNMTGVSPTVPPSTSAKMPVVIVAEEQRVVETRPDSTLPPTTTLKNEAESSSTAAPIVALKNETELLSTTAAMDVLKKEAELSPANTSNAMKKELSTVEGRVLPQIEDLLSSSPVVAPDSPPPPVAVHPEAEKGFQAAFHDYAEASTELPSTLAPVASEKTDAPGFWNGILGIFGGTKGSKRVKRSAGPIVVVIDQSTKSIIPNQTYFGAYRCEKALTVFTKFNPFDEKVSVYQRLFAWRTWGIILLGVHLLMVLYHVFVNYMHRVPTSQRFNRVFAGLGLFIWDAITLWTAYQYFVWNQKFDAFVPDFPAEFYAFLVLSVAMNSILLYEFFHRHLYLSYDITPRSARNGYTPCRQNESEYINGIIHQLEGAPSRPSSSTYKPEAVVVHP